MERLTNRLDITIVVDWDVKQHKTNTTKRKAGQPYLSYKHKAVLSKKGRTKKKKKRYKIKFEPSNEKKYHSVVRFVILQMCMPSYPVGLFG